MRSMHMSRKVIGSNEGELTVLVLTMIVMRDLDVQFKLVEVGCHLFAVLATNLSLLKGNVTYSFTRSPTV